MTESVPSMLHCESPDKNGALQSSFDYKTLKMTSNEVISQQRGKGTGFIFSFFTRECRGCVN